MPNTLLLYKRMNFEIFFSKSSGNLKTAKVSFTANIKHVGNAYIFDCRNYLI